MLLWGHLAGEGQSGYTWECLVKEFYFLAFWIEGLARHLDPAAVDAAGLV